MTEAIRNNYQVSSEGAVRHWEVSHARLEDNSPTATLPACLIDDAAAPGTGVQLTGTILTVDDVEDIAIIDFTCSMVYLHEVRTASGYNGADENAWTAINEGTPIYYDRSATMPAGVYLSLSPTDNNGVNNPLFGFAVREDDADTFAKAAGAAGNTWEQAVMQRGAGA